MGNLKNVPWLIIGAIFILVIGSAGIVYLLNFATIQRPEFILPMLVIFGVCVLLILLFLMATAFRALQMSDKTQPLCLLEGSIRAIVALLLILIWVMVSLYLFTVMAGQTANTHSDATQFAQNFYTTMATLVVAIVAFYFGSKSVAEATRIAGTPLQPIVRSLDSQEGRQDQMGVNLIIEGSGFQSPVTVLLSREIPGSPEEIIVTNILFTTTTQINCTIDIKSDQALGEWDLIVINSNGSESRRANAFKIHPPA